MKTNEFDEIIKNKVNEANFEFNPEHWEKAAQLIDTERAVLKNSTKNNFKYYIGIIIAFLCLIGVYSFYNISINTSNTKSNKTKELAKNNQLLAINTIDSKIDQTENNNRKQILNELKEEKSNITNNSTSNEQNTLSNASNLKKLKNNFANTNNQNEIKYKTENESSSKFIQSNSNQKFNSENEESLNKTKNNQVYSNSSSENGLSLVNDSSIKDNNEPQEDKIAIVLPTIYPNFSSFSTLNIDVDDNLLRTDYTPTKKDDEYYRDKKQKKQFLNVEANVLYNYGWSHLNQKKANAFNYNLGLNYGFYLSRKLSASFGAHCFSVRNVNQTIFSDTLSDFKFGVKSSTSEIINNHLMYLTIPLQINYHINTKNYLSAGVNIGTKIYSKNSIVTSSYIGEDIQSTNIEKNNFNYYNVADRNIMLEASYSTNVTKKLWIKAGVYYSVNDLFKQVNGIQNLKGLNIGIKYEIFDK